MPNCFVRFWQRHAPRCCFGSAREEENAGGSNDPAASGPESFVEVDVLRAELNAARKYPANRICTAKYTALTCFPRSLAYQFHKVSNVYFLTVMILSLIPGSSPVNPFSSILPFCIVLGAGISKDIWEDGKRRKSDRRANALEAFVLRGDDFVSVPSCEVRVGDVMLYRLGNEVVADSVLLNSSLTDGVTYIETASLDGETNAKMRRAKPETVAYLGTIEDIIENCLPDLAMQAHFKKYGTTEGWKKNTTAEAVSPAYTAVPTCGWEMRESSPEEMQRFSLLQLHDSHCDGAGGEAGRFRQILSAARGDPLATQKSELPSVHTRSRTFATPERVYSNAQLHHRRQLTFDERFAAEHEMPMPSDILEMSREYERRRRLRKTQSVLSLASGRAMSDPAASPGDGDGGQGNTGKLTKKEMIGTMGSIDSGSSGSSSSSGIVFLGAPPCPELYSWIGQMRLRDGTAVPLSIEEFLPRGCVIRNTEWVLCLAMYTGKDTKLFLNLRPRKTKVSLVEKRINIVSLFLVIVHQSLVFLFCVLALLWRNAHLEAPEGTKSGFSTWYIQWNLSHYFGGLFFGWRYLTNFVLISSLIPISLYVMLEFNKAMQTVLIARDRRMANYDAFKGELCYSRPKTSELNCQLAQVQYIFTDKTGTLTENLMTYVGGCTVAERHNEQERPGGLGESFLELLQHHSKGAADERKSEPKSSLLRLARLHQQLDFDEVAMESVPLYQYLRALSLCHTVVCFDRPTVEQAASSSFNATPLRGSTLDCSVDNVRPCGFELREPAAYEKQGSLGFGATISAFNTTVVNGVGKLLHGRTGSASWYATRHDDMLTHQRHATISQQVSRLKDDSKIYEGQSLDEIALVTAARNNLFALQKRSAKHMFIKVVDKVMCYEIIAELEFSSQRKLMSILLCRSPIDDNTDLRVSGEESSSYRRHANATLSKSLKFHPAQPPLHPQPHQTTGNTPGDREEDPVGKKNVLSTQANGGTSDSGTIEHSSKEGRRYLLLVKGADSSMMAILNKKNPKNAQMVPVFQRELERMAQNGLRTLVLGQRYLSEEEVCDWIPGFKEAQCSMHHRSEKLHSAYALIEKDIDLIGTTAVDDQLQKGVPETLSFFLQAEIVVWMLTGDKRETAVTIANASGLFDPKFGEYLFHLDVSDASASTFTPTGDGTDSSPVEMLRRQMEAITRGCDAADALYGDKRVVVMVVDGQSLDVIFGDEYCMQTFFELGTRSRSAVCCRLTPLQKAKVVKQFQKNTKAVTLAIGDGANDVSMILESHIGIGIMGLEGSQAELASDYAIPKFRFLKRLMMVHGRFALYRDAHCILFSLYKNAALTSSIIAYTFYSGFSGILFVDSWLLAMFNLLFCSLQPLIIGILDKDVEDELAEALPSLYPALGRDNMFFSWRYIFKWLFDGAVDGLVMFFVIMYTVAQSDGLYPYRSATLEDYGMLFYILLLILVNLRVSAQLTCYTIISVSVLTLTFLLIPALTLLYSALPHLFLSNWCVRVAMELMGTWKFWLLVLFTCGVFVVYGMAVNVYIALFSPWTNGGHAMRAAWRSKFRLEHQKCLKRLS